ncbi:transporter substrate-binding domain-containing protein [Mycolicibacterium sp. P1-5]|uniref:transporter substrate-binding domain-containing protein n=1 Tax=Mycolicibacterium sp. P1-5 TaxID=2024617 RepID=UPI0018844398|nr:transporter substrate-binding domain-containing protein [Mycolicibacterium sp. P1-5]
MTVATVVAASVAPAIASADEPAILTVCTTGDYRPLTYRDPTTGQYSGVDIDMATDLAAHLGREPVFVATTWSALVADLTAGKCDIAMGGITDTPERRRVAEVTRPYLASGKTPLVTVPNVGQLATIEQINRPEVRAIENSGGTNEQFARKNLPEAQLIIWPDNTTIFDQLAAGGADVMVTDAIEAIYQSSVHPELVAQHPEHPFTAEAKAYLLPKGSPIARRTDDWLADVLSDGTYARIYEHWLHTPAPDPPR